MDLIRYRRRSPSKQVVLNLTAPPSCVALARTNCRWRACFTRTGCICWGREWREETRKRRSRETTDGRRLSSESLQWRGRRRSEDEFAGSEGRPFEGRFYVEGIELRPKSGWRKDCSRIFSFLFIFYFFANVCKRKLV